MQLVEVRGEGMTTDGARLGVPYLLRRDDLIGVRFDYRNLPDAGRLNTVAWACVDADNGRQRRRRGGGWAGGDESGHGMWWFDGLADAARLKVIGQDGDEMIIDVVAESSRWS